MTDGPFGTLSYRWSARRTRDFGGGIRMLAGVSPGADLVGGEASMARVLWDRIRSVRSDASSSRRRLFAGPGWLALSGWYSSWSKRQRVGCDGVDPPRRACPGQVRTVPDPPATRH